MDVEERHKVCDLIEAMISADGVIGDVRFVSVMLHQPLAEEVQGAAPLPWRLDPSIAGGGLFVDLASHMLDFLDYALGPIAEVKGIASNQANAYPAEDMVSGAFRFESGVHGVGTWCFSAFDKRDRTEIVGTAGRITYATFDSTPIVVTTAEGTRELPIDSPPHIQQPLIQLVVNALNGIGESPSTGESALRTSWVMDQMLAGYASRATR